MSEQILDERLRAEEGQITDAAVALLRERCGVAIRVTTPGWHMATVDVMANYMHGMGDTNPLYRSESYATATRWGGLIGQPTFLRYTGRADESDPTGREANKGGRGDPLAGVHGYMSGVEIHWFRHIEPGDLITGSRRAVGSRDEGK